MEYRLAGAISESRLLTIGRWASAGLLALSLAGGGQAQTPAPGPSARAARPIGVVTAIDRTGQQITIKTDAGPEMTVRLQEGTAYWRVAPGETDLKKATPIESADIAVGDRIMARGRVSDDQQSIPATSVIVMKSAALAEKREADRAEWQKRSVAGLITVVNPDTKEITIATRVGEGTAPLVITPASNVRLRRYAPDSVKFSDARPGTFAELKPGDQVRALGRRSEEGGRLTAEAIVSGSFRNTAGTVVSVSPQQNMLTITDLETKKPLRVRINPDSNLRKLPPFVAQMIARRQAGGGAADAGGGRGRGGPPDVQQMLERMPALALSELKPGDALIVASTTGADPAQVTAITLLSGVEPLLTAAPPGGRPMMLGTWSLEMNMNLP